MNSRMERYLNSDNKNMLDSRVNKNQNLYGEINDQELSRINKDYNYKVIGDKPKEIDIDKIKEYISSLNEEKQERKRIKIDFEEEKPITEEEPKVYDINSIIEEARSKRENIYENDKYKKLHDTQYDILKKMEIYENKESEKGNEKFNTEERTLIDLINTVSYKKQDEDLLSELTSGNENTIVTKPIEEEIKEETVKENTSNLGSVDKSFYTNSLSFSKKDFEGIDEIEKEVTKSNRWFIFFMILLVTLIIGVLVVILNYVLDLGLF